MEAFNFRHIVPGRIPIIILNWQLLNFKSTSNGKPLRRQLCSSPKTRCRREMLPASRSHWGAKVTCRASRLLARRCTDVTLSP
jgi:hypothetical protein